MDNAIVYLLLIYSRPGKAGISLTAVLNNIHSAILSAFDQLS